MKTEQETFWSGEFGDAYTERNKNSFLPFRLAIFAKSLARTAGIASALEVGCNIGENLDALRHLFPAIKTAGIEINAMAAKQAEKKAMRSCVPRSSTHRPQIFLNSFSPAASLSTSIRARLRQPIASCSVTRAGMCC
ncbi:MAG: hypothetical protein HY244_19745 [Rhizobiales bacterium]|nr:hypothetical protein [Hyphomicrobiales bacterium]